MNNIFKRLAELFKSRIFTAVFAICFVIIIGGASAIVFMSINKGSETSPTSSTKASEIVTETGYSKGDITIKPLQSDVTGVDPNTTFSLVSKKPLDPDTLKRDLTVVPNQPYQIKKISDTQFELKFDNALNSNSIYRFQLPTATGSKYSWAFQTRKTLRPLRSLPADRAATVPIDSGIEITFGYSNITDFEKNFDIAPKTEGRFEYHGKTVVFVPNKLSYSTRYTITLEKGIGIKDSELKTEQDFIFSFTTQGQQASVNTNYLGTDMNMVTFDSKTQPYLVVFGDEQTMKSEIKSEIFKFKDSDQYLDCANTLRTSPVSDVDSISSKLEKVSSFSAKAAEFNNNFNSYQYLLFPEVLPEGHYLAKLVSGTSNPPVYVCIQISNMNPYIMIANSSAIAWVNDVTTSKPVTGADVSFGNSAAVKTDDNGYAQFKGDVKKQTIGGYIVKITADKISPYVTIVDEDYFYYGNYNNSSNQNTAINNYLYMYLDRSMYKPDDTVNIWGIVKPRKSDTAPKDGRLVLKNGYNNFLTENGSDSEIMSIPVTLNNLGTYKASMDLPTLDPGNYTISLVIDDVTYYTNSFNVSNYEKPAYTVNMTLDKKKIWLGDTVKAKISANFFEGTPISGLNLISYFNGMNGSEGPKVTTDINGNATINYKPNFSSENWNPQGCGITLQNANAEEQEIYSYADFIAFPHDRMIGLTQNISADSLSIDVRTNVLDINKPEGNYNSYYDYYSGAPVDMDLNINVEEVSYNAIEDGNYYDFINKVTVPKYRYEQVRTQVNNFALKTVSGVATISLPKPKDGAYYDVSASGMDSKNSPMTERLSIYPMYYVQQPGQSYFSSNDSQNYGRVKAGESVNVYLNYGSSRVQPADNKRTLFLVMSNGIKDHNVTGDTKYSLNFTDADIPNVYVQLIYFDGKSIYDAGMQQIVFDSSYRKLDISITPDKASYGPGDTANIKISVKDAIGKPVSAELALSVVDEAYFSIFPQEANLLDQLYSAIMPTGKIASFIQAKPGEYHGFGGAEQGGGEGGGTTYVRSNFKDTAFFDTAKTDASGTASVSIKLPDNLTSWRITSQALTDDLKAGSMKSDIVVTQPFFTNVIFSDIFIENDKPGITARVFGTKSVSGSDVDYSLSVQGPDSYKKDYSAKGKTGSFTSMQLDSLKSGEYSLTLTAKSGSYSDAIKKSFKVVPSVLEIPVSKKTKLVPGEKIDGGKGLTSLTFYNNESSIFYNSLESMAYQWGNRIDQMLARSMAPALIKKYYPENYQDYMSYSTVTLEDLLKYQNSQGGLSLFDYDSMDPELSAKISSTAPGYFDSNALKYYFYTVLSNKDSDPTQVASAYWGLASLSEPVLLDVESLLSTRDQTQQDKTANSASTTLGTKELIYLGLALADLGDMDGADAIYNEIYSKYGKTEAPYKKIDVPELKSADNMDLTSLMALLAMRLDTADKDELFSYIVDTSNDEILSNLEQLNYVVKCVPTAKLDGSFTYVLDGTEKTVDLKKAEVSRLLLTADKLSSFSIKSVTGDVYVTSTFTGPAGELLTFKPKSPVIKRSYSVNGKQTTSIKQSDLVEINVAVDFDESNPEGYYNMTDILPAGLRYVYKSGNNIGYDYYVERDGQKINIGYYNDKKHPHVEFVYYARAAATGSYTCDNAIIKKVDRDLAGITGRNQLTIAP